MRRSGAFFRQYIITTCLLALFLHQGCRGPGDSAVVLEFRPAVRAGGTLPRCELPEPLRDASVALPAGGTTEVRFAAENPIALSVTSRTRLIMRDITASNPTGIPSFEVVVFPEEAEANRIRRVLRERPGCYWLVTLGGKIVQLEFPGERGDGGISGGLFSSLDAALAAYRRVKDDVVVEVESDSEGTRTRAFWAWREKMDLWEMACDSEFQKQFRESDPKSFERLSETLRQVDCSVKPSPPADGAPNGG